ncbi:hypothetical protein Hanom_Chr16g01462151 [Helianthus anomalus]
MKPNEHIIFQILGPSSQPDTSEAEGIVDSNPLAIVAIGDVIDVTPEEIKLDRTKITEKRHEEEEKKKEKEAELEPLFDDIDNYDHNNDNDDDDDQGATGLLVVKPTTHHTLNDFLNDKLNEQQEDQHHEASSSGKQHASNQVFLTQPKVIYLHASFEGALEVDRKRESMLEELGMDDGHMKFDIEDEITPSPDREYTFKFANEADNFKDMIIEEGSDVSDEDTPFHYSCAASVFHRSSSLGDILSWSYLEDLQVYDIQREHGVQYFEFLSDIKTLPWWDVEELVQIKNIKQFYYSLDVKMHDQKLWNYIKLQAKNKFPD